MLEIKCSSLSSFEIAHSPEYIPLIHPPILSFLQQPTSIGEWITIEARLDNELVGLTLTEVYEQYWSHTAQLYSFIVKPSHRRQGIGRQLFSFTEHFLVTEKKIRSFEFIYIQEDPFAPAIEKILASQGWTSPRTMLIRCHFDANSFNPPWIHSGYALPHTMSFFPWKELLPEDRQRIQYLAYQRRVLPYLNPLQEEKLIDMETSVGLRHNGQIIGWSITHRPNPSTVIYSKLYIDSDFSYKGYGIQLLAESIRRHKNLPIPHAIFEVNIKEIDRSWAHFIKRRLFPWASRIEHLKKPFRLFQDPHSI